MYQSSVLDNKLRVLTSTMAHTQSISMVICVGAGSRYESDELAGVSHFIEHLPFKGTESWPTARAVSEAIEGVGGVMNASTDREMTVFWCKVARLHYKTAFAVLMDMVLNSRLDPEEVEKEREVIQEELRMTYDQPSYRVDLLIDEAMWPDQAMGRDVGGTLETVADIQQKDIREYMHQQYNPANTVVAVAGNVTHEEVVGMLAETTRDWKPLESLDWELATDNVEGPLVKVERRHSDQTHLCLGVPGLSLTHPDRYAFNLMNTILGDGMSSRLFLNLREEQGLAYDVHSSSSNYRDTGALVVYCGVEPSKTNDAVKTIVKEFQGMHQAPSEQELNKAREYSKGRLLLRMEDTRAVASWLGAQELLQDSVRTPEEVVESLDAVTPADIARVAKNFLNDDKMRLAVVGPRGGVKALTGMLRF
ncbi:MAG: insulinase family protein [SAR202 cluster bacterium]|nr:insulinase family protein [Dehalococcoidia bacterium]MQG50023.1 insulinase family protein [SAR202 cluster bacterium]MQG79606.1 insulinase family protein [SAR202 cluster bacterium]|tara:strand:- start:1622 stop:2884 length:1263 start_codon:yes stop_codon:yes gene_type:complete